MAADVARFEEAIDKVHKAFSTQEIQFDEQELRGPGAVKYVEQKFRHQLKRARAAFLQEFRNHSVVVETEISKIREELQVKLEEKYGARIRELKDAHDSVVGKEFVYKDEITSLSGLVRKHEDTIRELKRRDGDMGDKEKLVAEIVDLRTDLEAAREENAQLKQTLTSRDATIGQLRSDLEALDAELKSQVASWCEERDDLERQIKELRAEMLHNQEHFVSTLTQYQDRFEEYRARTSQELQLADLLNARRSEALARMEQDMQRLPRGGNAKPEERIGAALRPLPYEPSKDQTIYRKDDMGMDTAWRDYQGLSDLEPAAPAVGRQKASFQVHRAPRERQEPSAMPGFPPKASEILRGSVGSNGSQRSARGSSQRRGVPAPVSAPMPTATDTPRQGPYMRSLVPGPSPASP